MKNVLRKTFGVLAVLGGLVFAGIVLVGGFLLNCVWILTCVIAGGSD